MNYAEEQLQYAIDKENKTCYQESEKCPKNKKGKCTDSKICGNQYPAGTDYELECFRLEKENEILKDDKRQLDEWFTNAKNNIDTLEEENKEYKLANISLGNFRQKLENDIDKQKSYISELEYQSMEQAKKEDDLNNILTNREKEIMRMQEENDIDNAINSKLNNQIKELKNIIKILANLL